MPSREEDIKALLNRAEKDLHKIESQYDASLRNQSISADLKIDIKNFCENLRSVLDYLAHEIRETCCPTAKAQERFYFPIFPDQAQFEAQMARWFANLDIACPDLWRYLESIQPYNGDEKKWLGRFNRLNNENKHGALVEQTKTETKEIRATTKGGGQVSWNPANVRFGRGVYIGGVPVDPISQRPIPHPSLKVEDITWVDFRFAGIGVSALGLLKQSLHGVGAIANEIRNWL